MLGCHIYILFEKPLYIFIRKEGKNFAFAIIRRVALSRIRSL
jgi:hypothetical protein